ncbi:hypothetical protein BJX76DRAFT_287310 [Aspergillus varians]
MHATTIAVNPPHPTHSSPSSIPKHYYQDHPLTNHPRNHLDDASLLAQDTGLNPSLCATGSEFMQAYLTCVNCLEDTLSTNETSGGRPAGNQISNLNQIIGYCGGEESGTDTGGALDINSLLSSWSALASTQSAIQATLSSLGYNFSTTPTGTGTRTGTGVASTTLLGTATATATATATGGTDTGSDSSNSNVKVIVPAVVVPVVVVLIAAVVAAWVFMRRRQRRQGMEQNGVGKEEYEGKAQLHADSFRPELDSAMLVKATSTDRIDGVAELPAREPVGSEMDATTTSREGRDN